MESEISNNNNNNGNHLTEDMEKELLEDFKELFQPGRTFASRAILRSEIAKYGQKYNIVMSTKNSNYRSVHLWCKHAGIYKKGKRRIKKDLPPDRVVKPRKKDTKRTGCGCYIKAKLINEIWVIEHSQGEHNHSIPNNRTVYSIHRRQTDEIKTLILQLLTDGQKISHILEYLHMIGINNIIKKDIENLQQQFRRKEKLKIKREQEKNNNNSNNNNNTLPIIMNNNILQQQQDTFELVNHQDNNILYPTTNSMIPTIPIIHYTNPHQLNTPSSILSVKDTNNNMNAIVESIDISNNN